MACILQISQILSFGNKMNSIIIVLIQILSAIYLAYSFNNIIKKYKKSIELKNKLIDLQDDRLARMDIMTNECFQTIDYLLGHILKLNPDDQVAKESLLKVRRTKETTTEVWAEKAAERLKDGV